MKPIEYVRDVKSNCKHDYLFVIQAKNDGAWLDTVYGSLLFDIAHAKAMEVLKDPSKWMNGQPTELRIVRNKNPNLWQIIKKLADDKKLTTQEYDYFISKANLSPQEMDTLKEIAKEGSNEFKSLYNRDVKRFNNESFYTIDGERVYSFPFPL